MNIQLPRRMTVDEYLTWAVTQEGRWELVDGRPVRMAAETVNHIKVKSFVWLALSRAVQDAGLDFHVLSDGATVRISSDIANEPDCLVYAGPEREGDALEIPDPIIVVEVLSPTSGTRDKNRKKRDYFSLPSVAHYLIVDPAGKQVQHFERTTWETLGSTKGEADALLLEPQGLIVQLRGFFNMG